MTWWRSAVVYQIYPRSFADADGDGVGDLRGIRSKLDYLAALGVDALWLSPFYVSPQADAGYDVADHRDVDPLFGTLEDAVALIDDAHAHGLRLITDLVPNHTSSQHPWFQAALAAGPGSPERDRYHFRPGRGPGGELPPNNWVSNFGGPAWTRLPDGEWYLHLFAPEQPDLNWANPEVADEFDGILRFWLDRGVDGFRIDVAHGLAKDPALVDVPGGEAGHRLLPTNVGDHAHWDRDEVHEVYRRWRRIAEEYPGDRVFVAEAWVPNAERFARYLRPDELHTAFNFAFLQAGWDATALRRAIDTTLDRLRAVGAPATWVLSNHDVERHVTRFGGGDLGRRRARAALLLMLALPGGTYLYQGEELGLEEVRDLPDAVRQDPIFARTGGRRRGRDGCRVPLPWSGTTPPFGFGPTGTPWLPQPARWSARTVEREEADRGSMLWLYRDALARRRQLPLGDGTMQWVTTEGAVLAFTRPGGFACAVNVGSDAQPLPRSLAGGHVVLAGTPDVDVTPDVLPPDSAVWLSGVTPQ
jgi:alpha-glucosidase